MSGDIHVVPHQGKWAIAIEGTGVRTLYETQAAALVVAKEMAKNIQGGIDHIQRGRQDTGAEKARIHSLAPSFIFPFNFHKVISISLPHSPPRLPKDQSFGYNRCASRRRTSAK